LGTGTVNVSDSAVATDTKVKAGQVPSWETELTAGDEGVGKVTLYSQQDITHALLSAVSDQDFVIQCKFAIDKIPNTGALGWRIIGRALDSDNFYYLSASINSQQSVGLVLGKRVGGVESAILTITDIETILTNTSYFLKMQVSGISPTSLSGKIWRDSVTEPGWQITTSDSEAGLQGDGTIGLSAKVTTPANLPITVIFDNFEAIAP
jgi:hypothetical protein